MKDTEHYGLHLNGESDADLDQDFLEWRKGINGEDENSNMQILDRVIYGIQTLIENSPIAGIAGFVRKINNKVPNANGEIELTAEDIGAIGGDITHLEGDVPNTRKINGHSLSSDVTLTASDVGALPSSTTHLSGDVPTTRTINGHALTSDITISASDISGLDGYIGSGGSISGAAVEYAQSSSYTSAPLSGWSTTAPQRTPGQYTWQRISFTKSDGSSPIVSSAVCVTGEPGASGEGGSGPVDMTMLDQNNELKYGNSGLQYFSASGMTSSNNPSVNGAPDSHIWHIMRMNHDAGNSKGYYVDFGFDSSEDYVAYRRVNNSVQSGWHRMYDDSSIVYGDQPDPSDCFEGMIWLEPVE